MRTMNGQAALEYVLVLAGMLVVVSVLGWLLVAVTHQATRTENLVVSEYP